MDIQQKARWVAGLRVMSNYWRGRSVNRLTENEAIGQEAIERTLPIFKKALKDLNTQINELYVQYSNEVGLDVLELTRVLSGVDRNKFISHMHSVLKEVGLDVGDIYNREFLEKLTRLEAFKQQVYWEVEKLAKEQEEIQTEAYKEMVKRSYEETGNDIRRLAGDTTSPFQTITTQTLTELLKERWAGGNYSHRIWGNTSRLGKKLMDTLGTGLLIGYSQQRMANEVSERFDVTEYEMMRLIRTEANYFNNQAELQSYKDENIPYYRFDAILDGRTSHWCDPSQGGLGGMIFAVEDAIVGVNYPPLHPHCRSTTYPMYKDEIGSEKIWKSNDVLAGNHILVTASPPPKPRPTKPKPKPIVTDGMESITDYKSFKEYFASINPKFKPVRKRIEIYKKNILNAKSPKNAYSIILDRDHITSVYDNETAQMVYAFQELKLLPQVYAVNKEQFEFLEKNTKSALSIREIMRKLLAQNNAVDMRTMWADQTYLGGKQPLLKVINYAELSKSIAKDILTEKDWGLLVRTTGKEKWGNDTYLSMQFNPVKIEIEKYKKEGKGSEYISMMAETYTYLSRIYRGKSEKRVEAGWEERLGVDFLTQLMQFKGARERLFFGEGLPKEWWHFGNKVDVNNINRILRSGFKKAHSDMYNEQKFNEIVARYDKAFDQSKTQENMKLYRGVSFNENYTIDNFKVGSVQSTTDYWFTTERESLAKGYTSSEGDVAMLEIYLPKGSKALTVGQFYYENDQVLLARNTQYEVKRIYMSKEGYPVIQLQFLLPEQEKLEQRYYDMYRFDSKKIQPVETKTWEELMGDMTRSMLTKEEIDLVESTYQDFHIKRDFDEKPHAIHDYVMNSDKIERYPHGEIMMTYAKILNNKMRFENDDLTENAYQENIDNILGEMFGIAEPRNQLFTETQVPERWWHFGQDRATINEANAYIMGGYDAVKRKAKEYWSRADPMPEKDIKKMIEEYDRAFEKAQNKEDMTFFRGVSFSHNFNIDNFKVGGEYADNSFMFASPTKQNVEDYLFKNAVVDGKKVGILEIVTPKGSRVMTSGQFYDGRHTNILDKDQVLFDRDSKFMVLEISDEKAQVGDESFKYKHIKIQAMPKDVPNDYKQKLSDNVKGFSAELKPVERFKVKTAELRPLVQLHEVEKLTKKAKEYENAYEFVLDVYHKQIGRNVDAIQSMEGVSIDNLSRKEKYQEYITTGEEKIEKNEGIIRLKDYLPERFYEEKPVWVKNLAEEETYKTLLEVRGKPKKMITVYRLNQENREPQLHFGDMISLSERYARQQEHGFLEEFEVAVQDVKLTGHDINQFRYLPTERLKEVWKNRNDPSYKVAEKLVDEGLKYIKKERKEKWRKSEDMEILLKKVSKSKTAESFVKKEFKNWMGDKPAQEIEKLPQLTKMSIKDFDLTDPVELIMEQESGVEGLQKLETRDMYKDFVRRLRYKPYTEIEVFKPRGENTQGLGYGESVSLSKFNLQQRGYKDIELFKVQARDLRFDKSGIKKGNYSNPIYYPKEKLKGVWEATEGKKKINEKKLLTKVNIKDIRDKRYQYPVSKDIQKLLTRKGVSFKAYSPVDTSLGSYSPESRNIKLKLVDWYGDIKPEEMKKELGDVYTQALENGTDWAMALSKDIFTHKIFKDIPDEYVKKLFCQIPKERVMHSLYHEIGHLVDMQDFLSEHRAGEWNTGVHNIASGSVYSESPEWRAIGLEAYKKGTDDLTKILEKRMRTVFEYNFITSIRKKGNRLPSIDNELVLKIVNGDYDFKDGDMKLRTVKNNGESFVYPVMTDWRTEYAEKHHEMFADAFAWYMESPKEMEKQAPLVYNYVNKIWQKTKQKNKEWEMNLL